MKLQMILLAAALVPALLGACAAAPANTVVQTLAQSDAPVSADVSEEIDVPQTGWTEAVPAEYMRVSSQPGTVERLDYATKITSGTARISRRPPTFICPTATIRRIRRPAMM